MVEGPRLFPDDGPEPADGEPVDGSAQELAAVLDEVDGGNRTTRWRREKLDGQRWRTQVTMTAEEQEVLSLFDAGKEGAKDPKVVADRDAARLRTPSRMTRPPTRPRPSTSSSRRNSVTPA